MKSVRTQRVAERRQGKQIEEDCAPLPMALIIEAADSTSSLCPSKKCRLGLCTSVLQREEKVFVYVDLPAGRFSAYIFTCDPDLSRSRQLLPSLDSLSTSLVGMYTIPRTGRQNSWPSLPLARCRRLKARTGSRSSKELRSHDILSVMDRYTLTHAPRDENASIITVIPALIHRSTMLF